jgi:hypothetical protein
VEGGGRTGLFTDELRKNLPRLVFKEVALSNRNNAQKQEMGEDHIFGWDPAVLTLAEPDRDPRPLEPPKGEKWVARAPSVAEFEFKVAKIWGAAHRLIVVSVHAKSGGEAQTVHDVRMIGNAVDRLKAQHLQDADAPPTKLSILITGDFNLGPQRIGEELPKDYRLMFRSAAECPKTNIWKFNGCGDESSDGHAYDSGFFYSTTKDYTVSAALPPALVEQDQIYGEMKEVAATVLESLESIKISRELFNETTGLSGVTQRTLDAVMSTAGGDRVPSWLRKEFCHRVKLTWSDHLPIAMSITMPRAHGEPELAPE